MLCVNIELQNRTGRDDNIMASSYTYKGWVFSLIKEDSNGNAYYNVFHPSGRQWDHNRIFNSYSEVVDHVDSL